MQNQRGFVGVGVLIAILIGLAVLGGGTYYVVHQQSFSQISSDTTLDNSQTLPTNTTNSNQTPTQTTQNAPSLTQEASILFTASQNSGATPLAVHFVSNKYATQDAGEPQHYVDFGDGTERHRITCAKSTGTDLGNFRCLEWGVDHTYSSNGTYIAKLIEVAPCIGSTCPSVRQETVLKTITVNVSQGNGNSSSIQTPTATQGSSLIAATPMSGTAPLTVSFTLSTSQLSSHKTVSIDFGDGKTTGDCAPISACLSNPIFHQYSTAGTYIAILRGTNRVVLGTATITVSGQTTATAVNFDPQSVTSFRLSSGQTASDGSVMIRLDSITPQSTKNYWNITATITENGQPTSYTTSYTNYGKTEWESWLGSGFYKCAKVGCGNFHDTISPTGSICIAASVVPGRTDQAVITVQRSCEDG